jgi:hypothetical protein
MEMLRVRSTMIHSIGYEPQTHILIIRLWTGFTYRYFGVPENLLISLMNSQSKGRFYNSRIRGKFESERVE